MSEGDKSVQEFKPVEFADLAFGARAYSVYTQKYGCARALDSCSAVGPFRTWLKRIRRYS